MMPVFAHLEAADDLSEVVQNSQRPIIDLKTETIAPNQAADAASRATTNPPPSADCFSSAAARLEGVTEYGRVLAGAVSFLYRRGKVHRDIKPSNIIFVRGQPKLADIDLVKSIEATVSFAGTADYIPPEGPGTAAHDVFALGKVIYQMATGKPARDFPLPRKDYHLDIEHERWLGVE
jgi:serine/threonine protein kinase